MRRSRAKMFLPIILYSIFLKGLCVTSKEIHLISNYPWEKHLNSTSISVRKIYNGTFPLKIDHIYEEKLIFFSYGSTLFIYNFEEGYHIPIELFQYYAPGNPSYIKFVLIKETEFVFIGYIVQRDLVLILLDWRNRIPHKIINLNFPLISTNETIELWDIQYRPKTPFVLISSLKKIFIFLY